MKSQKTLQMAELALMGAVLCIISPFTIPLPVSPVPLSLSLLGVYLSAILLGGKSASLSVLVYLLLGMVGLPVFSGFRGGAAAFLMPSGGFLLGFLLTCLLYWAITAEFGQGKWVRLAAIAIGLIPCYWLGIQWMCRFYSIIVPLSARLLTALGFLIPDGVKIALAWYLSAKVRRCVR